MAQLASIPAHITPCAIALCPCHEGEVSIGFHRMELAAFLGAQPWLQTAIDAGESDTRKCGTVHDDDKFYICGTV